MICPLVVRVSTALTCAFVQGADYVRLPSIVERAESSPAAARAAASRIRRFLSTDRPVKDSYIQYNAIMLIRILIENPGETFTRSIDAKFVDAAKDLLRHGKDGYVQLFLRETLEILELTRPWDEHLAPLLLMWQKEKEKELDPSSRSKVSERTVAHSLTIANGAIQEIQETGGIGNVSGSGRSITSSPTTAAHASASR